MGLRAINYQNDYRSGYDNIVHDFFRPSLNEAKLYWRAVGYFSSSALEAFGQPLGDFISNDGTIRLVTSVILSESDLQAIQDGASRKDTCTERLDKIVSDNFMDGIGDGVARLVRLLELGRLEIKIAVPKTGTGIYHEKIGIFIDSDDDYVAFSGSSNESRNAFENNRECIDIFTSWDDLDRAKRKREHFEILWNGTDKGVEIYDFPEAVRKNLLRVVEEWQSKQGVESGGKIGKKKDAIEKSKWEHQEKALEEFLVAERGILNMATGTGKTRTSLNILQELHKRGDIDTVIVCTDGTDLLNQWTGELLKIRPKVGAKFFRHYESFHEMNDFLLKPKDSILLISRIPLASCLKNITDEIGKRTLLIHDEVHGLGSPANRKALKGLSNNIRFRLGLSATPERMYDSEGNDFILEHIGPEIMRFGLDNAIQQGILVPFKYYPLSYELTDDDRQRMRDVYKRQKASQSGKSPMSEVDVWIAIANVHKTSEAKIPVFEEFIKENVNLLERCIVFVETKEYGDKVLEIIQAHRPDFHTYYSGEDSETLRRFARGDLECLITCHRLSEGIDIQSLNSVILFSSARARLETIQRMGRCLRSDPHNPEKIANIVDFIRESDKDEELNTDEERAKWLIGLSKIRAKGGDR